MNLIKSNFSGIDASNDISLLEYGLLVYNGKHEDNSGTQFCVYRINEDAFGTGHISEDEINNLLNGKEWADKESLKGFFQFVGGKRNYIQNNSLVMKLYDLTGYFGYENIFGTDYSPITENEVTALYL